MIYKTTGLPDDDPPGVPLIGHENIAEAVVASSADIGYPASNLLNPATHLLWRAADKGEQRLSITTNGPSDYIAIAKHNFSRIGFGFTSNTEAAAGTLMSLLHFEVADGSTQIQDRSGRGHGWDCNGNAQVDQAQAKFGVGSCLFDGTGDYLRTDGAQFAFGLGDFTIDFWVRLNTTGTEKTLVDCRSADPQIAVLLRVTNTNVLQLYVNGSNRITGGSALSAGVWTHVALTRSGGIDTKLWYNGVQQGSTYSDTNNYVAASTVRVGANFSGANGHNGWIDEFRLLKGQAAWNAAFTPPTTQYLDGVAPAIGTYDLLMQFDQADGSTTFFDFGGNDHAITPHGNAQHDTAQARFGSASLLLDGTGDYITLDGSEDFTFTGDFTIDFWVRFNSIAGTQMLVDFRALGESTEYSSILIYKFTDHKLYVATATTEGIVGTTVLTTGTWYHVALTRAEGNVRLFLNGVQEGATLADFSTYAAGADRPAFGVSADGESSLFFNGWLDEIRIVNGIAFWSSTFVPQSIASGTYARSFSRAVPTTRPLILRHASLTANTLVLTIASHTYAEAAVLYVGEILALERGVKWDVQHQQLPHARKSSIVSGMSESGNFLGRVVLSEWREGKAEFAWFTPDWYRENFEPFVQTAVLKPFFWAWNPDDYPEETSFAWLIEDVQPETDPVTRRVAATISMRGLA